MNISRATGIILLCVFCMFRATAQDNRIQKIQYQLDSLSEHVPVLNDSLDISVTNVSIQEFLRGIAIANDINISIENGLQATIINNFNNVKFKDVLIFLVREYELDIELFGNIIVVKKYTKPTPPPAEYERKPISVSQTEENLFTVDLENDTLQYVAKKLTQISGKNIIVRTDIKNNKVSGYIQNQPIDKIVEHISLGNNLDFEHESDDIFVILSNNDVPERPSTRSSRTGSRNRDAHEENDYRFSFSIIDTSKQTISIQALKVPLDTIVQVIANALPVEYHILSDFNIERTLVAEEITFDQLLEVLYKGTEYSYKKLYGVYLLGEEKTNGLEEVKLIQLKYRTVEKLKQFFPRKIQEGLEIIEFEELNSLLVTGSPEKIKTFEDFIINIDKTVPVVLIEVMIVDVLKTHKISTGITAGRGVPQNETSGTFMPGVDVTLDSKNINRLLNSFNGYGWFSIGEVSNDFYLQLQALEQNGIIKVRSTPKLSTLNGHEATLTSGETRYYAEEQINTIANASTSQTKTTQYKAVNADLTISIKPIVSGNGQVTLEVNVTQTDFKTASNNNGPPNSTNRKFKSLIRIKDGEMVLLGGLERNENADTGSGTPLLSRIPIIKWFFSSREKSKSKSKLDIFIKPTIIY